jgi:hypothetical protein
MAFVFLAILQSKAPPIPDEAHAKRFYRRPDWPKSKPAPLHEQPRPFACACRCHRSIASTGSRSHTSRLPWRPVSIAGKGDLYRPGRCPKGVDSTHITADGFSTRWAIAKSLASWKFGKPSWSTLIAAPWVRDQLNMWIAGVTARESH